MAHRSPTRRQESTLMFLPDAPRSRRVRCRSARMVTTAFMPPPPMPSNSQAITERGRARREPAAQRTQREDEVGSREAGPCGRLMSLSLPYSGWKEVRVKK